MAARTADEILSSFQSSATLSDSTVDVTKGPLYSLIGYPLSQVLAPTETEVARLEQIYSVAFSQVATTDEASAFLTNWGETPGTGTPATVPVFFMSFSRPQPGQIIDIPLGSLVSNYDLSLQFITVEAGQILGDSADSYYNSARRSYEVMLQCQAVANGTQYNLPAGRIINIVSTLPGIDSVENRVDCTPGTLAETDQQAISRVQQKFTGLAVNTANGAYSRISNYAPTAVFAVTPITSSNRSLFRRIVYGPAVDYYILGQTYSVATESYTAVGGETSISIKSVPAVSVSSVFVNNVPITNFTLNKDTSLEYGLSAKAQDALVLAFPLLAGDVVTYSVTYNSLTQGIQQNLLSTTQLFNTDELAREFIPVPINIVITGRAISGYDPVALQNSISEQIQSLIPTTSWTEAFYPQSFFQSIQQNVFGVSNLQLTTFQRSSGAKSQVEIVLMAQNEIATYNVNNVSIQIRNV